MIVGVASKHYCIDEITMMVIKKMSGLFSAFYAAYIIPNITFSRISVTTSYSKSSQRGATITQGD